MDDARFNQHLTGLQSKLKETEAETPSRKYYARMISQLKDEYKKGLI